jgi:hypothetical protein
MKSLHQAALAAVAVMALSGCGGASSGPTPVTNPTPVPTPSATPAPVSTGLNCVPAPPPLYGIAVKVIFDSGGERRALDSRPQVINIDGYCAKAGFADSAKFCFTRTEGDPMAAACDMMAVGRAGDTGRFGPTWSYNGKPCTAGAGEPGCSNHDSNQFLVNTRGDGVYEACAAADIPLSQDPVRPGSRCGTCTIQGGGECQERR